MAEGDWMWAHTGQKFPVAYKLPDGTDVTSFLRHTGKSGIPERGSTVPILYDPLFPTTISRASTRLLLIVAMAALAFVAVAPWLR
ncbi:MAG: hypothetical protein JWR10_2169 [Rubritepida sp.]|nr:hypothetical protein [Rubritepida sp.]